MLFFVESYELKVVSSNTYNLQHTTYNIND